MIAWTSREMDDRLSRSNMLVWELVCNFGWISRAVTTCHQSDLNSMWMLQPDRYLAFNFWLASNRARTRPRNFHLLLYFKASEQVDLILSYHGYRKTWRSLFLPPGTKKQAYLWEHNLRDWNPLGILSVIKTRQSIIFPPRHCLPFNLFWKELSTLQYAPRTFQTWIMLVLSHSIFTLTSHPYINPAISDFVLQNRVPAFSVPNRSHTKPR